MFDPTLTTLVLRELIAAVSAWLRRRARRLGIRGALKPASIDGGGGGGNHPNAGGPSPPDAGPPAPNPGPGLTSGPGKCKDVGCSAAPGRPTSAWPMAGLVVLLVAASARRRRDG